MSSEEPFVFSKREEKRVQTLERRRDHVAQLSNNEKRTDLSFLQAEAAALTWALRIIEKERRKRTRAIKRRLE